jgi:hypothetical protein
MPVDLKTRRAWPGSLAFTTVVSTSAFLLLGLPALAGNGQAGVARLALFAIVIGLAFEGARRMKLARMQRALDRADPGYVMKIQINGVSVGAIPEPRYANLRIACAKEPRNYVVWFCELMGALWRHAIFTLSVVTAFAGLYLIASCLLSPDSTAQAILACLNATRAHADSVSGLGSALHALAAALVNLFVLFYLTLAGARITLNPPVSLLPAFREDLQRRIRMTLAVPVVGHMTVHRARAD